MGKPQLTGWVVGLGGLGDESGSGPGGAGSGTEFPSPARHTRLESCPPLHAPEQQSPPSLQDSPTFANVQDVVGLDVTGLRLGDLVGLVVTGLLLGDNVGSDVVGLEVTGLLLGDNVGSNVVVGLDVTGLEEGD